MKRLLVFLLFFSYSLASTELHQLLKLPLLVEHYRQHRLETPELSIVEFLHIHYAQGDVFDDDRDQDLKLPFKANDDCTVSPITALLSEFSGVELAIPKLLPALINAPVAESMTGSAYLSSIWQPPKFS